MILPSDNGNTENASPFAKPILFRNDKACCDIIAVKGAFVASLPV
jgi:hypothetical protein